jgi:hypothetical protein
MWDGTTLCICRKGYVVRNKQCVPAGREDGMKQPAARSHPRPPPKAPGGPDKSVPQPRMNADEIHEADQGKVPERKTSSGPGTSKPLPGTGTAGPGMKAHPAMKSHQLGEEPRPRMVHDDASRMPGYERQGLGEGDAARTGVEDHSRAQRVGLKPEL